MNEANTIAGERRRLWIRVGVLGLAIGQGIPALWALLAPRSWYDDFPGGGQNWVSALPPFNEHLVTDYGAAFLALSVMAGAAAILLDRRLMAVAMGCWLISALPHFLYHLGTLDAYDAGAEAVSSQVSLALSVLVPMLVLAALLRPGARSSAAAQTSP